MGLTGNQKLMWSQNRTLLESDSNGVDVHLFEVFKSGKYIYQGQVKLAGKPYQETQNDFEGNNRIVWIFPLELISGKSPALISEETFRKKQETRERKARSLPEEELIKRLSTYKPTRSIQKVASTQYVRNEYITELVKKRANGKCQLCDQNAPFHDKSGQPYLEAHHIQWLSKGGQDEIRNTVALCPNCHRKMHILNLEDDKRYLRSRASGKSARVKVLGKRRTI